MCGRIYRFMLRLLVLLLMLVIGNKVKATTGEENAVKVRLVGQQKHTGKVEIQYQGAWGVVCHGGWDIQDAHVICRMLGYKAAVAPIIHIEGETPRRMLLWKVKCSGTEKSIAECSHNGWWNIPSWSDCSGSNSNKLLAGVICQTNEDPPPVQVRLAGGESANSGRLDVRYHGQWGTVCNRGWDMKDAEVVCRMLGYPGVKEYITTNFIPVKGIIWISGVSCKGKETSIVSCSHWGFGSSGCFHNEDVGVTCKMAAAPVFTVISRSSSLLTCGTAKLVLNTNTTNVEESKLISSYQIVIKNAKGSQSSQNSSVIIRATLGTHLVGNFTIGDGKYYNGYYNAPLEPGSTYQVFVRAVTKAQNGEVVYGESANASFTTNNNCVDIGNSFPFVQT